MASVRYVSIEVGAGHPGRVRVVVSRSALIAAAHLAGRRALTVALATPIGQRLSNGPGSVDSTVASIRAAGVAIPFIALTYVWLGGSRGLKVMRHTLYVQWVAQPIAVDRADARALARREDGADRGVGATRGRGSSPRSRRAVFWWTLEPPVLARSAARRG